MSASRTSHLWLPATVFACVALPALTQEPKLTRPPATDTAAQASPLGARAAAGADDTASQASPADGPKPRPGSYLPAHAPIPLKLNHGIDSGKLRNGAIVRATLTAPLRVVGGPVLRAGTPVEMTVVATVPAGAISATGEFSLQVVHVGGIHVFTETQTFRGRPGHQDLPDSAPDIGTDAGLPAGAALTFHVQPAAVAVDGPPRHGGKTPGSVTGVAEGGPPPQGVKQPGGATGTGNIPSGNAPANVTPAANNAGPATNPENTGVTPTQPAAPNQTSPTSTQPR